MTRVYKISLQELQILRDSWDDDMMERDCPKCGNDLCVSCQTNSDIRQKLVDICSLVEVGWDIVITTADALIPKVPDFARKIAGEAMTEATKIAYSMIGANRKEIGDAIRAKRKELGYGE